MVAANSTLTGSSASTTFTASSGLISSPNFPQPYPQYIGKYYEILAPSLTTIKLQFLVFQVFAWPGYPCYWGDYLEVCVAFLCI